MFALLQMFESFYFPRSVFFEQGYNPAYKYEERCNIFATTGTSFGLPEFRTYALCGMFDHYYLSMSSFGDEIYRENIISGGAGFDLGDIRLGFGAGLLNQHIQDNCNRTCYSVRIGGMWSLERGAISGWAHNLNIPRFTSVDYLPITYSLKVSYLATDHIAVIAAARGMEKEVPLYSIGVSYMPISHVMLGMGVNTEPLYCEYMVCIFIGQFTVIYSGSNHQYLGLSHFFSLGMNI